MGNRIISVILVLMLSLGSTVQGMGTNDPGEVGPTVAPARPDAATEVLVSGEDLCSRINGHFVENIGQKGTGAGKYYCTGSPLSVAFDDDWVAYVLDPEGSGTGVMYRVLFPGSNDVEPVGFDQLDHELNYFIGNDPEGWRTSVRSFHSVVYPSLYDGIDLGFWIRDGMLKYEFHVEPGASTSAIRMSYVGIDGLQVEGETGDLVIRTAVGDVVDKAPVSFYEGSSGDDAVPSAFRLLDDATVGMVLGPYDASRPLVIDPGLNFSTYLGGNQNDLVGKGVMDAEGYIYMAGSTYSANFPTTPGSYDTTISAWMDDYVAKLDKGGGKLVFGTFIGGVGHDVCYGVAVDKFGNVLTGGWTWMVMDFPTTTGAVQPWPGGGGRDGWATKVKADGKSLIFSTYVGGSNEDFLYGVNLDDDSNVYLTGYTLSTNFPVTSGAYCTTHSGNQDAFLQKLNHNGTKYIYSTYLGGPEDDEGGFVAPNATGCAVVVGTGSKDFPTTNGSLNTTYQGNKDGFVTKLNANGTALVFSTYIGGSKWDWCESVDIHRTGSIFVIGTTYSSDFPTTTGALDTTLSGERDAFLIKLNESGDKLLFSTYLGGKEHENGCDVHADYNATVFVCIDTGSNDLTTTMDAIDTTFNGGLYDVYIARINKTGEKLEYGTYVGGSASDTTLGIQRGTNFTTVMGGTSSNDFPTTKGAYDTTFNGGFDGFITRLRMGPPSIIKAFRPSAPLNLNVTTGLGIVNLTWEVPTDLGGVRLKGYVMYRGHSEDNLTELNVLPPTSVFLQDHPPEMGRTYFYAIRAFNFLGEGNWSNVINVTPYDVPTHPRNIKATPGCRTVHLQWDPPLRLGGLPIDGYYLFRGIETYNVWLYQTLDNVTSFVDDDLVDGRMYTYALIAHNAEGNSTMSRTVSTVPASPPTAPYGLKAVPGDAFVSLSWKKPQYDNGRGILGYRILRGTAEDLAGGGT